MANFDGKLNSNEIFSAIYNMIISIETFSHNVSLDTTLIDSARVDGSLYGDTKLYYATNVLCSKVWGNDAEAPNLLKTARPRDPKVQAIRLDKTRYIPLTIDYYLSKRAFMDEKSFSQFTQSFISWINDTKRIYDYTYYSAFLGTDETELNNQSLECSAVSVDEPTDVTAKENEAKELARFISNLIHKLSDVTREYTDFGNLKAFSKDDIKIIWNDKYLDRIKYLDLPTIYHDANLSKFFGKYSLPEKYFGIKNTAAKTGDGTTVRLLNEVMYDNDIDKDFFAGELVPTGKSEAESYTQDDSIICKIIVGQLPPLMSSFEVGTSFYNPLSLTENKYLIWGFNTLEHLKDVPFITIRAKSATTKSTK